MIGDELRHRARRDVHDTQAITTAATMISRSCAMPIAVMMESSENTMSMTMICMITQKNTLASDLVSGLRHGSLDSA